MPMPKTTQINMRLTPELLAAWRRAAAAEGRSLSNWIILAVGKYLAAGKGKK